MHLVADFSTDKAGRFGITLLHSDHTSNDLPRDAPFRLFPISGIIAESEEELAEVTLCSVRLADMSGC
jgi:hypothetical protein